jgi:hypothetical protein
LTLHSIKKSNRPIFVAPQNLHAAMQSNRLSLVSGIRRLGSVSVTERNPFREKPMSKTAALPLVPTSGLFARFVATLDRVLMASARAAVRNGDLPYFGL